jgi:hypothetical protein
MYPQAEMRMLMKQWNIGQQVQQLDLNKSFRYTYTRFSEPIILKTLCPYNSDGILPSPVLMATSHFCREGIKY